MRTIDTFVFGSIRSCWSLLTCIRMAVLLHGSPAARVEFEAVMGGAGSAQATSSFLLRRRARFLQQETGPSSHPPRLRGAPLLLSTSPLPVGSAAEHAFSVRSPLGKAGGTAGESACLVSEGRGVAEREEVRLRIRWFWRQVACQSQVNTARIVGRLRAPWLFYHVVTA